MCTTFTLVMYVIINVVHYIHCTTMIFIFKEYFNIHSFGPKLYDNSLTSGVMQFLNQLNSIGYILPQGMEA